MVADDSIKSCAAGPLAPDDSPGGAYLDAEAATSAGAEDVAVSAAGGPNVSADSPMDDADETTPGLDLSEGDDCGAIDAASSGDGPGNKSAVIDASETADEAASPKKTSVAKKMAETQPDDDAGDAAPVWDWYILKVQVNREDTIRAALLRRIKIEALEQFFDEIVVPTEDVVEFNKSGKKKVVRRKLYPGYILVHMVVNDETWFLVRETPGVGDFTGSSGKPTPMSPKDVERILRLGVAQEAGGGQMKTAIPFKVGDRVRVKDGHFQNFEGEVDSIDEANGRITVMINIFNRSTPVELEHWQVESV